MRKPFLLALVLLSACKTVVTYEGTGGKGGAGGAGGAGGVGGTTTSTTSVTQTTSTTFTMTTSTTFTTTTSTTVTTTTTTVQPGCDNKGVCQDQDQDPTNDCVSCSFQGPCQMQLEACVNDKDCCLQQPDGACSPDSFVGCINNCGNDQQCVQKCQMSHPVGAKEYQDFLVCVVCQTCPNDCAEFGAMCP
jgi:hypothetical protein